MKKLILFFSMHSLLFLKQNTLEKFLYLLKIMVITINNILNLRSIRRPSP